MHTYSWNTCRNIYILELSCSQCDYVEQSDGDMSSSTKS